MGDETPAHMPRRARAGRRRAVRAPYAPHQHVSAETAHGHQAPSAAARRATCQAMRMPMHAGELVGDSDSSEAGVETDEANQFDGALARNAYLTRVRPTTSPPDRRPGGRGGQRGERILDTPSWGGLRAFPPTDGPERREVVAIEPDLAAVRGSSSSTSISCKVDLPDRSRQTIPSKREGGAPADLNT